MTDRIPLRRRPLGWLSDVNLAGLSDGDGLVWDDTARRWVPGSGSGGASGLIWLPSSGYDPDTFTVSGAGDDTHALTYLPLGLNGVTLNGLSLSYGVDFSIDWSTGVLTLLSAPSTDDVLEVWYVTTTNLIALTPDRPPAGTPLADTFNRAVSTTTPNPCSDGGSWTIQGGTWGISSDPAGRLESTTGGSTVDGHYMLRRDFGSYAVDMSIDNYRVVGVLPDSRLWIAYDPVAQSGYYVEFNGNTTADINRYESGAGTSLGASITTTRWFNLTWQTLRLVHDGFGNIDFYQGATLLASISDPSPPLTGTWVGLSTPGTNRDFWQNFTADNV